MNEGAAMRRDDDYPNDAERAADPLAGFKWARQHSAKVETPERPANDQDATGRAGGRNEAGGADGPAGAENATGEAGAGAHHTSEPEGKGHGEGRSDEGLSPDLAEALARLAKLDPLEYDRVRKAEAERLGVREKTLDASVRFAQKSEADDDLPGRRLDLPDVEPWPAAVDGAAVLAETAAAIARHVALPPGAADALALYVAYTHGFEAFYFAPRLAITSPEKRCGKSTLLRVVGFLVARPLPAANITAAAVFRSIEVARPTLLIDEADTFLAEKEELRGVLNAGHARDGCVIRTVGDDHEVRMFAVWAPVAVAMIGKLPDTLADRSISIAMRRRLPDETVERLPRRDPRGAFEPLRRKLRRFMLDAADALATAEPALPAHLNDRAADNWGPLFAVAHAAGGDWPERAGAACTKLTNGVGEADDDDTGRARLWQDIRAAFGDLDKMTSKELCEALAADETSPWAAWGRQEKPITQNQLARFLRPYEITPGTIKLASGKTAKGYHRHALDDAFVRYATKPPS
jgi:putative DNA primase/helicase